jgi:hypothetical protein
VGEFLSQISRDIYRQRMREERWKKKEDAKRERKEKVGERGSKKEEGQKSRYDVQEKDKT